MLTAKVIYNSGLILVIPKTSNAPMLFLEWLSKFRAGANIVHKVIDNEVGIIKIKLNCPRDEYLECADYINDNL